MTTDAPRTFHDILQKIRNEKISEKETSLEPNGDLLGMIFVTLIKQ